jgi:hypothetical protein
MIMWLKALCRRRLGWSPTYRLGRSQAVRRYRLQLEVLESRDLLNVGPIDVIGHLPVAEYNQFIANVVNVEGNPLKDWGSEPCVAVNPTNPNEIVVSTFAYSPDYGPVMSGPGATQASLWYSTDGGNNWVIRFPIPGFPAPGQAVPEDQTFAYDANGVLHGAFLTSSKNIFQGATADPNLDGINGRPASIWQWNPNRVNLPDTTLDSADQPWIALQDNHVYVGYNYQAGDPHGTPSTALQERVSASFDNGATFTSDHAISNGFRAAFVNPGVRVATDSVGNTYAIFESADPSLPGVLDGQPQMVHYRLNESSDGGATWKYTHNDPIGGLVIDDGMSLQLGSSFGGVNFTYLITALAADPTGAHVYAVYGKEDASGTDRLYLAEFHPDSSGNLVERANPVALSVPGQRSALPSIAVTANGTIAVQYDTFSANDGQFHVYLATSTDQGLTFANQGLDDFTPAGIPPIFAGNNRLLGDYQYLIAQGNTVYGTFAARGNVSDAGTGIDTTDKIDPFFYSITLSGDSPRSVAPSTPGNRAARIHGRGVWEILVPGPSASGTAMASTAVAGPSSLASLGNSASLLISGMNTRAGTTPPNPNPILPPLQSSAIIQAMPMPHLAPPIKAQSQVMEAFRHHKSPATHTEALDLVFAEFGDGSARLDEWSR